MYLNGGRVNTGIDALEWAKKAEELGAGEILLTSMDCDGTKAGYDIELTKAVSTESTISVALCIAFARYKYGFLRFITF